MVGDLSGTRTSLIGLGEIARAYVLGLACRNKSMGPEMRWKGNIPIRHQPGSHIRRVELGMGVDGDTGWAGGPGMVGYDEYMPDVSSSSSMHYPAWGKT